MERRIVTTGLADIMTESTPAAFSDFNKRPNITAPMMLIPMHRTAKATPVVLNSNCFGATLYQTGIIDA